MGSCPEPGEPGFSEGVAAGFLLRVALRLFEQVGSGLPLVNAIQQRFPGMGQADAGRWATVAGQAAAAAEWVNHAAPGDQIPMEMVPVVPGSGLWADNPMDRLQFGVIAVGEDDSGSRLFHQFSVFHDAGPTVEQIGESVDAFGECAKLADENTDCFRVARLVQTRVQFVIAQF